MSAATIWVCICFGSFFIGAWCASLCLSSAMREIESEYQREIRRLRVQYADLYNRQQQLEMQETFGVPDLWPPEDWPQDGE